MNMQHKGFRAARYLAAFAIAALLFASASNAADKQKNKKTTPPPAEPAVTPPPAADTDQIETGIGEMLGAFQLGDIETMHKHYADNVTFVSGDYEPPVVGWQNYAALYARQRAAFQGMQLIRRNTLIITHTDVAWAMYQWEFDSQVNGRAYMLRGQTTLIFNKIDGNWLIVHNHTSGIYPQATTTAEQTAPAAAATRP